MLFSNTENVPEDAVQTKYISTESASVLKDSQEKEETASLRNLAELIKYGVTSKRNAPVTKNLLQLVTTVLNALQVLPQQQMETHASATKMAEYSILRPGFVRADATLIKSGKITSVVVFLDTVGGIKTVEDAQIMLIQVLTNLLAFLKIQIPTISLRKTFALNVKETKS